MEEQVTLIFFTSSGVILPILFEYNLLVGANNNIFNIKYLHLNFSSSKTKSKFIFSNPSSIIELNELLLFPLILFLIKLPLQLFLKIFNVYFSILISFKIFESLYEDLIYHI